MRTAHIMLFSILVLQGLKCSASHIIGGSIHYEDLGGGNFEISLTLYRDCSSNTQYDDPASIGCFNSSGVLVANLEIPIADATVTSVPTESYSACYQAPLGLCVQEAIYVGTVNLPPIPGGYTLAYQRCCRNFSIENIPTGNNVGVTLTTTIPGSNEVPYNSNPIFTNHPPLVICLNAPFSYHETGFDPDGDQLVYEFCAPLNTTVFGGYVNPPGAPPYPAIGYNAGYSATSPIDASPAFTINSATGSISGTPTALGQFVIGVCISEYRNGLLINQTNRDFQLNVTTCAALDAPAIASQLDTCSGLTVEFLNESVSGLTYHWDFGDAAIASDTSNVYAPTYTYNSPGSYEIMLVLNPNLPCADTTYATYFSSPSLNPIIDTFWHECNDGTLEFSFVGHGGTNNSATYTWDFGPFSNPVNSAITNVNGVLLSSAIQSQWVSFTVAQDGCVETDSVLVTQPPEVIAAITPQSTFCDGFTYDFGNDSQGAETYHWDFGPGGSIDFEPSYTYSDTGLYHVQLIAMSPHVCPDTAYSDMLIYGWLHPYYDVPDGQCLEGNGFSFDALGATNSNAIYQWSFGPSALPNSSSLPHPTNVHYLQPGVYPVVLTITENDCVRSFEDTIEVFEQPVFAAHADTIQACSFASAFFQGESVAPTPVSYLWDFGDGQTSTLPSLSHGYTEPGVYDVSVDMWTTSACIANAHLDFQNIIQITAPPTAAFQISNQSLALPGMAVQIQSLAQNVVECSYVISDGGVSDACDFEYIFGESGVITITQTVTDAYGCSGSISGEVVIKGYVFFAPNTFTPDADGINDVWMAEMTGVQAYHVAIYNRWGEMIFESNDPDQAWTGNVKGGDYFAPDGVYSFVAVFNDIVGTPHEEKGHIVLTR